MMGSVRLLTLKCRAMTAQASTTEMFCVEMARVTSLHHNTSPCITLYCCMLLHLFLAVVSTILPMAAPATSTARQLTSPYTPTSCREASSDPPVGTPGWCLVGRE